MPVTALKYLCWKRHTKNLSSRQGHLPNFKDKEELRMDMLHSRVGKILVCHQLPHEEFIYFE